jgi:hypothetical protein
MNPELKNTKSKCNILWARIAQSLQRLATGFTVRGSNQVGGEIFHPCPDRPWGSPSLLYSEYRVFPCGKAAAAWRWPPTPSSTEVKVRVESYTSTPQLGLRGCSRVNFTFTFKCNILRWEVRHKFNKMKSPYPCTIFEHMTTENDFSCQVF